MEIIFHVESPMKRPLFRIISSSTLLWILALAWPATADVIEWANSSEVGQLSKPYDDETASFTVNTSTNGVTFTLDHRHTTSGMDSASQWAINRWPEAPNFSPDSGNFHIVSNGDNDIVLGLYGFYGDDGFTANTPADEITIPQEGDSVAYSLSLGFDTPVSDLQFEINNINALTKPTGFNSSDELLIEAFVGGSGTASPNYLRDGSGYVRDGDVLGGNWFNRIGLFNEPPYETADQHVTSEGSVLLRFETPVDLVTLTLTNVAENAPEPFQPGFDDPDTPNTEERLQTWAFSVGDLHFTTIPEPSSTLLALSGALLLMFRRSKRGC